MADTVRQVSIKGDAAASYLKVPKGGRRTTRKAPREDESQAGGYDTVPGSALQRASNAAPLIAQASHTMRAGAKAFSAKQKGGALHPGSPYPDATVLRTPAVGAGLAAGTVPLGALPSVGGNLHIGPGRLPTGGFAAPNPPAPDVPAPRPAATSGGGKLILAPNKKTRSKLLLAPRKPSQVSHKQTRKIRVQLSGLKKRMTKAKAIHKDSREKSIEEIRKLLEEAKLVKPSSKKVPEDVLRAIYKDYLLLRNKAL